MNKYLKIIAGATTHYVNVDTITLADLDAAAPTTECNLVLTNNTNSVQIVGTDFDANTVNAVTKAMKAAAVSDYTKVVHEVEVPIGQTFTSVQVV